MKNAHLHGNLLMFNSVLGMYDINMILDRCVQKTSNIANIYYPNHIVQYISRNKSHFCSKDTEATVHFQFLFL